MTVAITPLLLSELTLPAFHPRAGAACPVYGFIIDHPGGPVLFDTGIGTDNEEIDEAYPATHHPLESALARIGVELNEVQMVINSHLHFDHCGNNRLFPGVPMAVQETEFAATRQPGYTVPEWIDFPAAEWLQVDGEAEIVPGIRALPTPGHTPGHQSIVITNGVDVDVIAGQAVYDRDELEFEGSTEPLEGKESELTSSSARRIKAEGPGRVFFSHDPRVWTPGDAHD